MYVIDSKINRSLYAVRDYLTSEYLNWVLSYKVDVTEHKRKLAKGAISCFLLNAYKRNTNNTINIGLTLDANNYSKKVIVNGKKTNRSVSYRYSRSFITFLEQEEYITLFVGGMMYVYQTRQRIKLMLQKILSFSWKI